MSSAARVVTREMRGGKMRVVYTGDAAANRNRANARADRRFLD
jgi:hypothetical protein